LFNRFLRVFPKLSFWKPRKQRVKKGLREGSVQYFWETYCIFDAPRPLFNRFLRVFLKRDFWNHVKSEWTTVSTRDMCNTFGKHIAFPIRIFPFSLFFYVCSGMPFSENHVKNEWQIDSAGSFWAFLGPGGQVKHVKTRRFSKKRRSMY